ncbi:MAG: YARHG domain-containing protein [Lachnospiraceae bacterium]|nr:YARHG domain-containing protein [Lachnospiraceae bacterium]
MDKSKKSKMPLVVGLIAFLVIAGAAVLAGVFLAKRPNSENDTVAKEATSARETLAPQITIGETEEPSERPTNEPTPEVTTEPVDVYQVYYDGMEKRFRKYIVDTAEASRIDMYSNMLKDALTQKDAAMCSAVKKNLDKLERKLLKSSKKKTAEIKKQLSSWEKKDSSAETKKSTGYQKAKSRAKRLEKKGMFADARSQYLECIKMLKDAKAAASKKLANRSTEYYKPVWKDDDTCELLSNYNLSKSDVARLSYEEIRYYVNTIFAVAGYKFKSKEIQEFFEYQSWYGGGVTSRQQDIIDLLNSPDAYKGTPLSDNFKLLQKGRS